MVIAVFFLITSFVMVHSIIKHQIEKRVRET